MSWVGLEEDIAAEFSDVRPEVKGDPGAWEQIKSNTWTGLRYRTSGVVCSAERPCRKCGRTIPRRMGQRGRPFEYCSDDCKRSAELPRRRAQYRVHGRKTPQKWKPIPRDRWRRKTVVVAGERLTISELAARAGVSRQTMYERLKKCAPADAVQMGLGRCRSN